MGELPRLCAITDPRVCTPSVVDAVAGLTRAATEPVIVQLRDKDASEGELAACARLLVPVTIDRGHLLLINGSVEVARDVGASGVHLPDTGTSISDAKAAIPDGFLISCARHNAGDVITAGVQGADMVLLSPVFPTPSKPGGMPIGLDAIRDAQASPADVYALGGIDSYDRACAALAVTHGIAGIRLFFDPSCANHRQKLVSPSRIR